MALAIAGWFVAGAGECAAAEATPASARHVADKRTLLPPGFEARAAEAMHAWRIPGLAIAVSRGGREQLLTLGRLHEGREPSVGPDTRFMIASITKTYTAAAIARLVDDGRLRWDDPVRRHLPEFRVADERLGDAVTVRDLVAMRSGIDTEGDWLEEVPFATAATVLERMRHLRQAYPFRSRYEYNNYNYVVLGLLIERVAGVPWHEFVRRRLLEPLGLRNTAMTPQEFIPVRHLAPGGELPLPGAPVGLDALRSPVTDVAARHGMHPPFASEHALHPDELENGVVPFARFSIEASTSAFASVRDLHRWARMWLGLGELDGVRVLERATVAEMRELHSLAVPPPVARYAPPAERIATRTTDEVGYGFGLQVGTYGDHAFYGHSGGDIGVGSHAYVVPDADLAVVVLVNNSLYGGGGRAAAALLHRILDHALGYPERDWDGEFRAAYLADAREQRERLANLRTSLATRAPSPLPLAAYSGTYDDHAHRGRIEVLRGARGLELVLPSAAAAIEVDPVLRGHRAWARTLPSPRVADLVHLGGATFEVVWRGPRRSHEWLRFRIDAGRPVALEWPEDARGGAETFVRVER